MRAGLADADGAIGVGTVGQGGDVADIAGLGRVHVLAATNVQKGPGTIWTFDRRASSTANVQIGPDPFWTLAVD